MRAWWSALVPASVTIGVPATTFAGIVVQSPITVPITRSAERLWPLACLVALPTAVWLVDVGNRWLERAAGRARAVRVRLLLVVAGLGGSGVAAGTITAAVTGGPTHTGEIVRNFGLVLGATLLADRGPLRHVLWAPGLLGILACWVLGSSPFGGRPAAWAILLQPLSGGAAPLVADVVASLVTIVGVATFVSGRSSRSA